MPIQPPPATTARAPGAARAAMRVGVGEVAQVVDAVEVGARHGQPPRLGRRSRAAAGRSRADSPVGERDAAGGGVDLGHRGAGHAARCRARRRTPPGARAPARARTRRAGSPSTAAGARRAARARRPPARCGPRSPRRAAPRRPSRRRGRRRRSRGSQTWRRRQREELLARPRVVADEPVQRGGDRRGARLLHAADRHAQCARPRARRRRPSARARAAASRRPAWSAAPGPAARGRSGRRRARAWTAR